MGSRFVGADSLRYLVTGSREWGNWRACEDFIRALLPGDEVAHGNARGADGMVHNLLTHPRNRTRGTMRARRVISHGPKTTGTQPGGHSKGDIDVHVYPADWARYEGSNGKNPAGMIRNGEMLSDFGPDYCIYFHDELEVGVGGTGDMVKRCEQADVIVFSWEEFVEKQRGSHDE